jgi:biotin transport system substrate-specific component
MSSTTLALAASPARARSTLAWRVVLVVAGSWLVAGLAQVEVHLPVTPVPVTGQTFGVLLVGASLGGGLGAASMGLYLAQGAIGLPFFSGGEGGAGSLALSAVTGGYLWGFVASAGLVGWLAQRRWDRSLGSAIGAMFLGEVAVYLVGIPWLMQSLDVSLARALELGLAPFVVGDTLKLLLAAAVLPAGWRLARSR